MRGLELENFTPQALLNFWKKGKSLYPSLYVWTNSELRKEYGALELKQHNQNRQVFKDKDIIPSIALTLIDVNHSIQLNSEIDRARDKLKWDLLEDILAEKLIGLGYENPVKASDKPQIIPLHIWPRIIKEINWENSSISKHGINFSDIRLIKKSALKNKLDIKNKIYLPKIRIEDKKTGRPSLQNEIIEAYEYLKKEGSIDYSKTLKSHTEIIQKTVQTLHPEIKDTAGMAHEAIRRAISKLFQSDKNNL